MPCLSVSKESSRQILPADCKTHFHVNILIWIHCTRYCCCCCCEIKESLQLLWHTYKTSSLASTIHTCTICCKHTRRYILNYILNLQNAHSHHMRYEVPTSPLVSDGIRMRPRNSFNLSIRLQINNYGCLKINWTTLTPWNKAQYQTEVLFSE